MTNLIQLTDNHYAVKVPKDAHETEFANTLDGYRFLFKANTESESYWKRIVETIKYYPSHYKDYENEGLYYYDALASGHSLLKSKGIYLVNPMGERPMRTDEYEYDGGQESYEMHVAEWQSFEDKVGNYLILEKL